MSVSYENQLRLTDHLLERVESRLSGREDAECLDVFPHDYYQLGVLSPWQARAEEILQPDVTATPIPDLDSPQANGAPARTRPPTSSSGEEFEETGSPSSIEDEEGERVTREDILRPRGAPAALGIEFMLAPQSAVELDVEARFAFYTRRFPTWEQQSAWMRVEEDGTRTASGTTLPLADRHVRHEVQVGPVRVALPLDTSRRARLPLIEAPFQEAIAQVLNQERTNLYVWRRMTRMSAPSRVFATKETYEAWLASLREEIDLPPITVQLDVRTVAMPSGDVRVQLYVVNATPQVERSVAANASRFLIDTRLSCHVRDTLVPIEMAATAEDYQYDPRIWAIGQSCAVDVVMRTAEESILQTQALASYDQPRLVTKNDPPADFSVLSRDPFPLLSRIYERMVAYADDWARQLETGAIELRNDQEVEACRADLEAFRAETARFLEGMSALRADARLLAAFKAMHRVFERVGASRGISRWRLFQLGFIVTQLPALAVREGFESSALDYADVLWFPTGGGKTEAYLGLISCALLYDRLRGKTGGVTAWLRFPLRMLSVQQLQRAVKVVHETEKERQDLLGTEAERSDPVSLGYFVGKSSTPNQLTNQAWAGKWQLSNLTARKEVREQLRLVRACPECDRPYVEVEVDVDRERIRHICQACGTELQIHVSDDEVYRYLPSVLIGTVDKLPSVAWRQHFVQLWGGVEYRCPEHGYSRGRYCIVFGCKNERQPVALYDPVPALQIQDELHLLKEELGTFAGHYESLATLCQERAWLPPKILAATATVEGVDRQSRHLYGLSARRFPGRGYRLGESFYTTYARTSAGEVEVARRYRAFRSPFLRPPEAATRILEIVHDEIRTLYRVLEEEGAAAFAARVGGLGSISRDRALALLNNYDTTLTYVSTKAHGSYVERELSDNIGDRLPQAGDRRLETAFLNGESSLDDIASTIDNLEAESEWKDEERLDAVVGTSLISHGVDVSRFNVMVMSGIPGRTAEYIQSSSRSGRRYVGMVIAVLSPWSLRDQSLYHRFDAYHYHMERLVEPVPINRFSRFAVDKTLPGVLAGVLNAYLSPEVSRDLTKLRDLQRALLTDRLFTEERIEELVEAAYGLNESLFPESLRLALGERLEARLRTELRRLRSPSTGERVTDAFSSKPMMSLRDIDTPVPFEPKEYTYPLLRWLDR